MEAVAWFAGREHTDHPPCVSPVIGAFLRSWNDSLPSDEDRDRLLKKYVPLVVGTATSKKDEETRAWLATDWLARECAPAWLRLAGLTDHAETLERLAPLVSSRPATKAQPKLSAARSAAYSAAYSAADSAAYSAADSAAEQKLAPTVKALQQSACLLLDRMIAVGKDA